MTDKTWSSISAAFERAAKYIHAKGGYKAEYLTDKEVKPLIDKTYEAFSEAVDYGLRDNEIPTAMRLYLQDNVFVFSGFKAHTELRQASALLRDASGQIKPFNRFLTDIQKIDKDYNKTYLQAEYNFAVASSQAAARWQEIAEDGDDFLLQYRTAKDERVREQHRLLDGITLPPSDKFWDEYYVPLGWNCRCSVVQVSPRRYPQSDSEEALQRGRAATYQPNAKGQNKAQIFRFNSGKQKVIFPPKHPYLKAPEAKTDIDKLTNNHNIKEARAHIKSRIKGFQLNRPEFGGKTATAPNSSVGEMFSKGLNQNHIVDIIDNLSYYLDVKPTFETPNHDKQGKNANTVGFHNFSKPYGGNIPELENATIEVLFKEYNDGNIFLYFVRIIK